MSPRATLTAIVLVLAATAAIAQTQHGAKPSDPAQPYAGQQSRSIASLSAEEQEGFRDGRGMGLAKSAELNGYPGPMHVLELEKELGLTAEQRQRVQAAFDRMKARARELGAKYIAAERAIDRAFKAGGTDEATVAALVAEAHRLLGEVRVSHLAAHVEITPLLTAEQSARYAHLRGYANGSDHDKHKH
jgi:Spy/CpxP family protein refolding chaperone